MAKKRVVRRAIPTTVQKDHNDLKRTVSTKYNTRSKMNLRVDVDGEADMALQSEVDDGVTGREMVGGGEEANERRR